MYFYSCPYCDPCDASKLVRIKVKNVACKYKKKDDYCEEKHKCKEVFRCIKCNETFKITKKFSEKQKTKIKDG